jgi:hypothetical protein
MHLDEPRFVGEKKLLVFPNMPVAIGYPGNWMI